MKLFIKVCLPVASQGLTSGWQDLNLRLHTPKVWLLAAELHPVSTPGGGRTHKNKAQILSLPRLPIPPQERVLMLPVGVEPTRMNCF